MSILPPGWKTTTIGHISKCVRAGGTPSRGVPEYWNGAIPFVKIEDITSSHGSITTTVETITEVGLSASSAWLVPEGSVLVAMYASIGEVAINRIPVATNQAIIAIVPDREVIEPSFLYYFMLYSRAKLTTHAIQTTQKNVTKGIIENWPVLIPPLSEQVRIARCLCSVERAIEARRRELALERERKAALMDYLFTHGTRGEPTKQTEIGEMPESWQVVELGAIAEIAYGLTVNESRRKSVRRAPYLTVANVSRGALHLDEVKEIGMLNGDEENYRLRKGDILFIEGSGNPALLGSAAVWNDELPFALHQNHLIRARLDQSVAFPEWVMNYVNSDFGRSQLLGKGKTSSGLHNINSRVISHIRIPMPTTLEQQAIVEVLLACDRSSKTIEREILVLDEFFHALLEELISGHLAVQSLM